MKQLLLEILPDSPPALDNFVAGRNGELLACLQAMAAGQGERFVYLWGETGSGRSHLLQAVARAGERALYVARGTPLPDGDDLPDLLAVDDVHTLSDAGQIELFVLYNRLRDGGGRLLAAGSCAPRDLGLRPDLVTRLGWGLVYQLHALDDGEKEDALYAHALGRGFRLPREVVAYLMRRWRRDLPSLIGALDALDRYSLELQRPITVPLLKDLLDGR